MKSIAKHIVTIAAGATVGHLLGTYAPLWVSLVYYTSLGAFIGLCLAIKQETRP